MPKAFLSLLFLLLVWSCTGSPGEGYTPVPRPRAYPRLPQTDTVHLRVAGAPEGFTANAAANVTREKPKGPGEWLTVDYPQYGAKVYYTFTPVDSTDIREVTDNRLERIALNFGELPYTTSPLSTPAGWEGAIFATREPAALPVQFLLGSPATIVSGSLFIPAFAENPDSIRPAVEAIRLDIIKSLRSIR